MTDIATLLEAAAKALNEAAEMLKGKETAPRQPSISPDGYEYTGEYRCAIDGEMWAEYGPKVCLGATRLPVWILRKRARPAKEPGQRAYEAFMGDVPDSVWAKASQMRWAAVEAALMPGPNDWMLRESCGIPKPLDEAALFCSGYDIIHKPAGR